jgi:hypothetical protein
MSVIFPVGSKVTDRKLYDSWIRGRFEKNLRIERGSVDTTTPTIVAGVGFSVVRNGVGDVTITFDPPFSSTMSITSNGVGTVALAVYVFSRDASTARLVRNQITVGNQDGVLDFVATGPS